MTNPDFDSIVAELTAAEAADRTEAAEHAAAWPDTYSAAQASELATTLLRIAEHEVDRDAKEAQLNAVAELTRENVVPQEVLRLVTAVPDPRDDPRVTENLEYLQSLLSRSG